MQAPASVIDLVKKFDRNLHAYKSGTYNETQVRVEFINPFFEALGWDVYNKSGCSEQYKDVIHEFSLKTQEYSNAPDYLFKVGTMKKFFVEAKKPIIYIKEDIHPAYQLRRYAWSAKLPLSILTDFEEFAVYDCRLKPNQKDKASVARRLYYTFREYPDMWGEIHSKFSREAVLQGEYDKFAEGGTRVKGTEVDDAFLQEIEGWRDSLARNIALRNPRLSGGELNYSVQKIIDRIIFLRICEGRGIEEFKELHNLSGKNDIYKHLITLFKNADKKYNSGLFHFTKEKDITEDIDNITPVLSIDDKIFKDIIESLYYPKSPYEFSVFGAEILGHVYEQFLGKVIRLTAGHQAKVEEKPEVKKAGGVYYTPAYIVDYIVKNTLGKKLEEIEGKGKGKGGGKEIIEEAGRLRVLDPACGSGSFLLGAYQYLLDWHIKIYQSHEKEFKERVYRTGKEMDTDLHLTTKEKKRILLNNIYGVDIDSQAVEVSKLSLLLKVLEGETDETLSKQLDIFTERALPDLSQNIKCGNSLIDTDYYDNETLFEQETSVNPFNWHKGFPEVFKNGGFDVVIGNPPYISIENLNVSTKNYLFYKYKSCQGRTDIYIAFIENCLPKLNKSGIFSFIIPFAFTNQVYGTLLREQLVNNYNINEIVDTSSYYIFNKAKVKNIIINISNKYIKDNSVTIKKFISEVNFIADIKTEFRVNQREFLTLKDLRLETKPFSNLIKLKNKIDNISIKFDQICFIAYGARLNHRTKNIHKSNYVYDKHSKGLKAFFEGKNIDRYLIEQYGWLDYKPGEHYNPMFPELFENEKISFINVVKDRLRFALDRKGMYNSHTVINCVKYDKLLKCTHVSVRKALKEIDIEKCKLYDYSFLLAILNSKLITWYFRSFLSEGLHFYPNDAKMLPIININNSFNCENRDNIKLLVNSLEASYYERSKTSFPTHSEALDHKIAHFEQKINKIVYELYGLTEEEIKIVEGKE